MERTRLAFFDDAPVFGLAVLLDLMAIDGFQNEFVNEMDLVRHVHIPTSLER